MIINRSGLIIRLAVGDLRVMGRATQGVKLISLRDGDSIAAITKVEVEEEVVSELEDENADIVDGDLSNEFDTMPTENENSSDDSINFENNEEDGSNIDIEE
jgi:DNA gyrase subunit A